MRLIERILIVMLGVCVSACSNQDLMFNETDEATTLQQIDSFFKSRGFERFEPSDSMLSNAYVISSREEALEWMNSLTFPNMQNLDESRSSSRFTVPLTLVKRLGDESLYEFTVEIFDISFTIFKTFSNPIQESGIRINMHGPIAPGEQKPQINVRVLNAGWYKTIILGVTFSYVFSYDGNGAGWRRSVDYVCDIDGSDIVIVTKNEKY